MPYRSRQPTIDLRPVPRDSGRFGGQLALGLVLSSWSASGIAAVLGPGFYLDSPFILTSGSYTTDSPLNAFVSTASSHVISLSGNTSLVFSSSPVTLSSSGSLGHALFAQDNSVVTTTAATGPTISASGQAAAGVFATGSANVSLSNASISTSGAPLLTPPTVASAAYGAIAQGTSTVSLTGGSVTTSGQAATAVFAAGGTVNLTNVAVRTTATTAVNLSGQFFGADGVTANQGGLATVSGGTIVTDGSFSAGVRAVGTNSRVTASGGLTITTNRDNAVGAQADNGGSVNLDGVTVTINGQATGLLAAAGSLTASNTTVTTSQFLANGASATGGGVLDLTNVSLATTGSAANGLFVTDSGSRATVRRSAITTGASNGVRLAAGSSAALTDGTTIRSGGTGIYADGASTGSMTGGSIGVTGFSAYGVFATGAGTAVTLDGVTVTSTSNASNGLYAVQGARIDATGSNISVSGVTGSGVFAQQAGSILNLSNSTVQTDRQNGFGMRALGPASISATNGSQVTTLQANSSGVFVDQGGTATLANSSIATHGNFSFGIYTQGGSVTTASTVPVTTVGQNAYGLMLVGTTAGTRLTGTGVTVDTQGANASGAQMLFGVDMSLTDSSIATHGANAEAIASYADAATPNTFVATRVTLASDAATTIDASGGTTIMTLNGVRSTSGVNRLLHVGADATGRAYFPAASTEYTPPAVPAANAPIVLNLTASASNLAGDSTVDNGATANLTLDQATTLTGAFTTSGTSSLVLKNGSTWNVTGDSNVTALTNDNSLIAFTPPPNGSAIRTQAVAPGYKTLTTNSYTGSNGTIAMNTFLGSDGAPSDLLVVNQGTASGQTAIRIANTGGAGAVTQANGIQVIGTSNGGTTAPTAFALSGRAVAGPYEYRLFRGALDGSNPDAWYLRSEQAITPSPPDQNGVVPLPPAEPLYRPEVSAYLANQRVAGQMFVHSLHDRLGEPQYLEGQGFDPQQDKPRAGWLRVVGKWEGSRSKDDNLKASTDSFLLHGGAELATWRVASQQDRLHAGVMASYGYGSTDAQAMGNPARAKGRTEGWSVGAYGTWYQNDEQKLGAYVDTWFQYGWFDNRVEGDQSPTVKYHAQGVAVSAEGGYAVPVRSGWVAEPQAQILYLGYWQNDVAETNGTQVTNGNTNGVMTRLGLRTHKTYLREDGRKLQPYATVNWWYSSVNNAISFNQVQVGDLYPRNRFEIKLGVNADLGRRWTGWANVAGAWGQQSYYQYAVRLGAKYAW